MARRRPNGAAAAANGAAKPGLPKGATDGAKAANGVNGSKPPAANGSPASSPASSPGSRWKIPEVPLPSMFAHMLERQSFVDLRRRAVTLIDVVSERHHHSMKPHRLLIAAAVAILYRLFVFPWSREWGVEATAAEAGDRAGGPWSMVSWEWALMLTVVYLLSVLVGAQVMSSREPAVGNVFECMLAYNALHVVLNATLGVQLLAEAYALGFSHPWGNRLDFTERGHRLGMLIWCQYHLKQLELADTVFVIVRKKFHGMSFLHVFLRLVQMWGWYFACRFACGGDAYFPAAVNAFCQVIVYAFYTIHMINEKGLPLIRKAHVTEVQVLQFVICATHASYCLAMGNMPRPVAAISLGVAFSGVLLYVEWKGHQPHIHPRSDIELSMFGHMFNTESLTAVRRRSMTLIDVVAERHGNGPLMPHRLLGAFVVALLYWYYLLPACRDWGVGRWKHQAQAGGPWSEVHYSFGVFVSLLYVAAVSLGVRIMDGRPPVRKRVFEYMLIYNAVMVLFNALLCFNLWLEAWRLGFTMPWGNELDTSERSHHLGMLLWFQYHCRQLELVDTMFIIARKKFNRMSGLNIFLRLVHMWGWFFACRFACGGDSYFPAAVNCTCQVVVYAYYLISMLSERGVPLMRKAWVAEIQVLQFVLCAAHACFVLHRGNLPRPVALLSLFTMGVSLALFTDFGGDHPKLGSQLSEQNQVGGRLTFRFDSSAWFYMYHFGVAQFLKEHMLPEGMTLDQFASDKFPQGLAFSGASGGALVAAGLASGVNLRDLLEFVLKQHPICRRAPWKLFAACERALNAFLPENAAVSMSGRVRVLLTKVSWKPPFITGEVVDQYTDWIDAYKGLRASCHVPGLNVFPYPYHGRYYYDGLVWSSLFVPWSGGQGDLVVKVSALAAPLSDIAAPMAPWWWAVFPPDIDVLRGMFWTGYRDAARWFASPPTDGGLCRCRIPRSPSLKDMNGRRTEAAGEASVGNEPSTPSGTDPEDKSRVRKHAVARSMLLKPAPPPGKELPEIDTATGQKVEDLIRAYREGINRGFKQAFRFGMIGAAIGVAVLAINLRRWLGASSV